MKGVSNFRLTEIHNFFFFSSRRRHTRLVSDRSSDVCSSDLSDFKFLGYVDAVYQHCVAQELEVAWPPTNMPWGVREMHVRHPDGHVFRLSQAIEEGPE